MHGIDLSQNNFAINYQQCKIIRRLSFKCLLRKGLYTLSTGQWTVYIGPCRGWRNDHVHARFCQKNQLNQTNQNEVKMYDFGPSGHGLSLNSDLFLKLFTSSLRFETAWTLGVSIFLNFPKR